jgi:vacuolar-type H+-ATPase subunit C/Vma6
MTPRWRLAYSYAKTSGRLSKSFLGPRLKLIAECENVHDLYALVFGGPAPQLTVPDLIDQAGRALNDRLHATYLLVEKLFGGGNPFISQTIRRVEYDNAKTILRALRRKESALPALKPAQGTTEIKREAYPDPVGLFGGTRFDWLSDKVMDGEIWSLENKLDRQYFIELMDCARRLPLKDRSRLISTIVMESRLENAVWAVRLNVFYQMDAQRIGESLITFPRIDVAKAALEAAEISPDDKARWSSWPFAQLVNEESRSVPWRIDPAAVERSAGIRLYASLRRLYHSGPFSLIPAYAFLRLKQIEGDFIRSCFEGMRMSMSPSELGSLLGVRI